MGEKYTAYWCEKKWPTRVYTILYELLYAHVVFLIPLGVMTFAYVNICRELWSMSAWRASMHAGR